MRQARTNPRRSSFGPGRPGQEDPLFSRPAGDQPIDIFPAITHFADTVTALPKELIRHFTLLKEVDAKIFTPQEQLFKLVCSATNGDFPDTRQNQDGTAAGATESVPMSAQTSSASHPPNGLPLPPSDDLTAATGVYDPANIPKRQLYRQIAFKIQEMLVSLEEKNHVISTANDVLQRQLARVNDVWPHLENEFSEEAKWGSTTHWAYPENRSGRSQPERMRRDGAAAISAAAQALADEAAARSDARKQALQAKRSLKNANQGSDMDEVVKKSSKVRRAADSDSVGLGISGAGGQKRRKTEKGVNGGTAMERTASSALSAASKSKGSPRGTPVPEPKKRKALPTGGAQAKKKYVASQKQVLGFANNSILTSTHRNGLPNKTTSATSSPTLGLLPDPKIRGSPLLTSAPRPTTARARQNSIHAAENGRPIGLKANGAGEDTPKADAADGASKETATKAESVKAEQDDVPPQPSSRRESKAEASESKVETAVLPPVPPTVTTKSGRASKPSTPALATFQDAALSRASRTRDNRKNHRKTNSTARSLAITAEEETASSIQDEDEDGDVDGDEPTYCYCNSVSYGEMVACDSDDCAREWFHLACVGLKVAPGSKSKFSLLLKFCFLAS